KVMDPLMGWLLRVPYDVAILVVGLSTSILMAVLYKLATNQDLLRRCKADKVRLGQLRKQAKKAKDKKAVQNIDMTIGGIQLKKMVAEFKGLGAAIIPIMFVASWAFERLDFKPPQVGEDLTLKATFAIETKGEPAWVVVQPQGKIEPLTPTMQPIVEDPNIDPYNGQKIEAGQNGMVEWKFRVKEPCDNLTARICYRGKATVHNLKVGGPHYGDSIVVYGADNPGPWMNCSTMAMMTQPRLLEHVPGMTWAWKKWQWIANIPQHTEPSEGWQAPWRAGCWKMAWHYVLMTLWGISRIAWLPPWIMAYIIICAPSMFLVRWLIRAY
ncbi:MAG: EMC3/TMCO1 family protein, partial [Phycisphaerae bacterium]|nr:EMC3/TMCO1 family protein [Phycisphaerae bacterium]